MRRLAYSTNLDMHPLDELPFLSIYCNTLLSTPTIILLAIQALFLPYMLWLLVMIIAGRCKDKPFPEPARNLQIAVIICARNEEAVIGKLIDSLKAQDYPADCFEVILIAHNCTDKTAEVGRQRGAVVWEAIQTDHPCKGTALTYAIDRIDSTPIVFLTLTILSIQAI